MSLIKLREDNVSAYIKSITELPAFSDAYNKLLQQIAEDNPHDIQMSLENMSMDPDSSCILESGTEYSYNRHALTQIMSKIKPTGVSGFAGYLAACPPELRAINFNYWHSTNKYPWNGVFRINKYGDTNVIRSMVSRSYTKYDDDQLFADMAKILPADAHVRSARGDITSRYDIYWPNQYAQITDLPVYVGARFSNSEVAASSVKILPIVSLGQHQLLLPYDSTNLIRHVPGVNGKLHASILDINNVIDPFIKSVKGLESVTIDWKLSKENHAADDLTLAWLICKQVGINVDANSPVLSVFVSEISRYGNRVPVIGIALAFFNVVSNWPIADAEEIQMNISKFLTRHQHTSYLYE